MASDLYTEPGLSKLRKLVKDEPEWAVNRLVADRKQHAADVEALAEQERMLDYEIRSHCWTRGPNGEIWEMTDDAMQKHLADLKARAEEGSKHESGL